MLDWFAQDGGPSATRDVELWCGKQFLWNHEIALLKSSRFLRIHKNHSESTKEMTFLPGWLLSNRKCRNLCEEVNKNQGPIAPWLVIVKVNRWLFLGWHYFFNSLLFNLSVTNRWFKQPAPIIEHIILYITGHNLNTLFNDQTEVGAYERLDFFYCNQ